VKPKGWLRLCRVEQRKHMFFKWLVLGKGGVDDVGREPADSSDNAVSVAMVHWNVENRVFAVEQFFWNSDSVVTIKRLLRRKFNVERRGAIPDRNTILRWVEAFKRSTLNFRRKRRWTVTTESPFLKNCSTANTLCSTFQCTIATETALSELSAGSSPTSLTPPLPSTSHLKNMRFLCSTLYKRFATPRLWEALPTLLVLYDGDLSDR